jgi:hypothetical protein
MTAISTDLARSAGRADNEHGNLKPESIAQVSQIFMSPPTYI